jgi:hypothetical protein
MLQDMYLYKLKELEVTNSSRINGLGEGRVRLYKVRLV